MSDAARHLLITGRVQGVGYREWAARTARSLGLLGWVRNRFDGRVEAVVAGDAECVDAFVASCRHGPSAARVQVVDDRSVDPPPLDGFAILPTH